MSSMLTYWACKVDRRLDAIERTLQTLLELEELRMKHGHPMLRKKTLDTLLSGLREAHKDEG